jgi:catechol 2,3-dioxygenase-like lactoylglutathione lyase family enzyme
MSNLIIENTIPVLACRDVAASVHFYCEKLGFQLDWQGSGQPPQIASVSHAGHAIMLQRRDPIHAGCVWIGVDGMAELWEKARSAGIVILQRPTNQPWALEMKVSDPDGNVLWFGQESLKGVPFGVEVEEELLRRETPKTP